MKKKREIIFILVMITAILIMVFYAASRTSYRIPEEESKMPQFSQSHRAYIKNHDYVYLYIPKNLQYLKRGFLEEYINALISSSSMTVKLVNEQDDRQQGAIKVVDQDLRTKANQLNFTAPILQLTGNMFVDKSARGSSFKQLSGVAVKGRLDADKTIYYGEKSVDMTFADTEEDAIRLAEEADKDCIIGDRMAIVNELKKQGLENRYRDTGKELYRENICIIVDSKNTDLYNILNKCIQGADKGVLVSQAQNHWYGLPETLIKEDKYSDAAMLLIIVFAAVFCAFFFYYQSNKNLYNELTDRMEQLVASKQEMQTTFNGVSYYMAELDPKGMVIDINEAFLKYIKQEPMGKHIAEVLELDNGLQTMLEENIRNTILTGSADQIEVTLRRIILEINIFPIKSTKGQVEKLLFMASDVTGERMAERQLLQDNKMIAVGQLAAGVAHEIRNPLGLIRNYCYVLKNMDNERSKAQAIQIIEKSVDTSDKIIENLLNFSKVSQQNREKINLKEHVDSVLSLNAGLFKKKQIELSVLCLSDFQVILSVESFDMVLINLVSNAVDAMEAAGKLDICISLEDDVFMITVEDNGSGIEDEIIEEIFNPFFTTKSNTEGNGLGLYIVYNEVRKMNGSIEVDSEKGQGTIFKVTLPIETEG